MIKRWPLTGPVDLRTSLHAGVSVLMFDTYGADQGSAGPFVGAGPLGVEVPLSESWLLVVEPLKVVLPVPHVKGAPLAYPQYRMTIGFQFGG